MAVSLALAVEVEKEEAAAAAATEKRSSNQSRDLGTKAVLSGYCLDKQQLLHWNAPNKYTSERLSNTKTKAIANTTTTKKSNK